MKTVHTDFRRKMVHHFNLDDLRSLTFDLDIMWDDLSGDTVSAKVYSLVTYCEHRGRLNELLALVRSVRPNVHWPELPSRFFPESAQYSQNATTLSEVTVLQAHRMSIVNTSRYQRWADDTTEEHYIPGESRVLPLYASPQDDQLSGKRENLLSIIREHNRLIVLGEPGTGKTVAMERMMWEAASKEKLAIPVYVPLLTFNGDLEHSIRLSLQETGALRFGQAEAVTSFLHDVPCLIMLDGLNEIPGQHRREAVKSITELLNEHPLHRYIVTSRSQDQLWRQLRASGAIQDAVVIQRITNEQAYNYLIAHLGERAGKDLYYRLNERMRDLARTPLLLWLIKEAARESQEMPGNRGELFDRFVNRILARDVRFDEKANLMEWQYRKSVLKLGLARLAFALQESQQLMFERKRAIDSISYIDKTYTAEMILMDALKHGLLQGEQNIRFMHQTMQEYFVALHLNRLIQREIRLSSWIYGFKRLLRRDVVSRARDDWWAESFVQLAGLTVSSSSSKWLVHRILTVNPWLAFWCSIEGKPVPQETRLPIEKKTITLLKSKDTLEKLKALQELGRMKNPRTIQYIVPTLADADANVREIASKILAEQGEPATDSLAEALEGSHYARRAAIRALGQMWELPELVQLGSQFAPERYQAALNLGKLGNPQTLRPLITTLRDSNRDVRMGVIKALEAFGQSAVEPLLAALAHKDEHVRSAAATALGVIGDRRASIPLIQLLNEPNKSVLVAAIEALGVLKDPQAIEPLQDLLRNRGGDRSVQFEARNALKRITGRYDFYWGTY